MTAFAASGFAVETANLISDDGTRLNALLFRARNPIACLIIVHGLQSHAEWYRDTGEALAANGVSVLAYDRRGSGRSDGRRGDGDLAGKHFAHDLDAAVRCAAAEAGEVHLLANCFATRFVLPYAREHLGALRSIILTSPATNMKPQADYGPLSRAGIALMLPLDLVPGIDLSVPTPLRNSYFVSSGPRLDWINKDCRGLHRVTPSFLTGANKATKAMRKTLGTVQTPLLILLAENDAIVENKNIEESFACYPGPIRLRRFDSEHMLEFGKSSARYRSEVLAWVRGGYRGAAISSAVKAGASKTVPNQAIWLTNGSQVDFEGLDEIEAQIFGRGLTALDDGRPLPRFEGFFDDFVERSYTIPRSRQTGKCLTPEAEWALVFRDPAQLDAVFSDSDPNRIDARIRALRVELRGMIEGKWLDVLAGEKKHPEWIPASGGNNVVAQRGWRTTISDLDSGAVPGHTQISVYRVSRGSVPTVGAQPLYFSTLAEAWESDHFKALKANRRGAPPFFSITRAVLDRFRQRAGANVPLSHLRAINLSALGKRDALVNDEERRNAARKTFFGTKMLLAFGRFAGIRSSQREPRIGMHLITTKAVSEGWNNCLSPEDDYLLIHTEAGPGSREIGRARLCADTERNASSPTFRLSSTSKH